MRKNINWTNVVLWLVYLALLAVLLPHTAWLFSRFEAGDGITVTAWSAAFAFEAAIAVLTHKMARHIEEGPRRAKGWRRFSYRYLNAFSIGLMMAVGVSALANLAHAVEFGQRLVIFDEWGVAPKFYELAFGAVLPVVSLLFARVLSNVSETEDEESEAEQKNKELRRRLRESERRAKAAEEMRGLAEEVAAMYSALGSEIAAERIRAAYQLWPELPRRSVAVVAGSSASYVTEVLSENGRGGMVKKESER